jgi:hypothetical protein
MDQLWLKDVVQSATEFFTSAVDVIRLLKVELEDTTQRSEECKPWQHRDILTLEEAASMLRISIDALAEEAIAGRVPAKQLGSEWRFEKYALKRCLDQRIGSTKLEFVENLDLQRRSDLSNGNHQSEDQLS